MMPTLTYPWALLLLLLLPGLAWRHVHRGHAAWRFSDQRLLPANLGRRARWAQHGGVTIRLIGLSLAILALTGPRWPDSASRIPTHGISIAMVVDVSVSMSNIDFPSDAGPISRLAGVKNLFSLFVRGGQASPEVQLAGRSNDLIALVTFATHPETACPLTLDHQALLEIMKRQQPRVAAGEGTTNPGDAIIWALQMLQQAPTRRKVLVFLTDGEANVPEGVQVKQAAQLAANLGVSIYTIDASPEPTNAAEIEDLRKTRAAMTAIAKMTEGQYFRAEDVRGLVGAYQSIDALERDRIVSFQYPLYHEGFVWLAMGSLLMWMLVIFLESTWWRVVP